MSLGLAPAAAAAEEEQAAQDERDRLEMDLEELLQKLENMDLFTVAELEKVQELTDALMDALDAAHDNGGLEDSETVKDADRKLIECENTLTRLEREISQLDVRRCIGDAL